MRRRPRDLLDDDADARVAPLELRDEVADDLALAAHPPEAHGGAAFLSAPHRPRARPAASAAARAAAQLRERASSHPPVKPARRSPATM